MAAHFGQLAEFNRDQDNWDIYVKRLNFFFVANTITDANKKRAIMLSSCGAVTYKLFKGFTAPSKTNEVSFDNLCKLTSAHKHPTPKPIAERFWFNTRNRESTESVATYVAELRPLTEHSDYGESLDSMLRDRLVCGINDERIQRCLLSEGATLTLEKAIDTAQAMESASRQSALIQIINKKVGMQ